MAGGIKAGSLFSDEGLILNGIENLSLTDANTWYGWTSPTKYASVAIQNSGDTAFDISLDQNAVFTVKSGGPIVLDSQLQAQTIYFRCSVASQTLQVIKLV
jgi:hypothetical protein